MLCDGEMVERWLTEIRNELLTPEKEKRDTQRARKSDRDDYDFAVYWVTRDLKYLIELLDAMRDYALHSVLNAMRVMKRETTEALKKGVKPRGVGEIEATCKVAVVSEVWKWVEKELKAKWKKYEKEV